MSIPISSPFIPPTELRQKSGTGSITLTKDSGFKQSLLEIACDVATAKHYIDIKVGATTILRLVQPVSTEPIIAKAENIKDGKGVLGLIREILNDNSLIYAEENEDVVIEASDTGDILQLWYYKTASKGERTLSFGSQAMKRIVVASVTHSVALDSDAAFSLDTSLNAVGLPQIKDSYVVPPQQRFTLFGVIFYSPIATATVINKLHIRDETTDLFTPESRDGVDVKNGQNLLKIDANLKLITKLATPYVFETGHTISLKIDVDYDDSNSISAQTAILTLIGVMEYLGKVK